MDSSSTFPINKSNADVLQIVQDFTCCGIVTQTHNESRPQFAAPMVRITLTNRLFTEPCDLFRAQDFEHFLEINIRRMRLFALRESLSRR